MNMKSINSKLLDELAKKLKVSERQVYRRIQKKVNENHLEPHIAAILLAAENGIAISKYATEEDLQVLRGTRRSVPPSPTPQVTIATGKGSTVEIEPIKVSLSFVSDSDLKAILKRDIEELNLAQSHGFKESAKTCMVLSGSIVEAMLLDVLLQNSAAALAASSAVNSKAPKKIGSWDLYHMVEVATSMSPPLLPKDAKTGADQLRKWRNLIHPGREIKETKTNRIKPTAARARNAVAFLQFVADELTS